MPARHGFAQEQLRRRTARRELSATLPPGAPQQASRLAKTGPPIPHFTEPRAFASGHVTTKPG